MPDYEVLYDLETEEGLDAAIIASEQELASGGAILFILFIHAASLFTTLTLLCFLQMVPMKCSGNMYNALQTFLYQIGFDFGTGGDPIGFIVWGSVLLPLVISSTIRIVKLTKRMFFTAI